MEVGKGEWRGRARKMMKEKERKGNVTYIITLILFEVK